MGEQPQHTLYLPAYHIARTQVTHAQYLSYVSAGHRQPVNWENGKPLTEGRDNYPVTYVSWHDAVGYCRWLSEVTGRSYRLPSEAEWEKGARGRDGRIYPWGNGRENGRSTPYESGRMPLAPVGAYPNNRSPYGLLDMVGNAREWTRSLYKGYPYDPADGREDQSAKGDRVVRGGSFRANAYGGRCAVRHTCQYDWNYSIGFRVVHAPG